MVTTPCIPYTGLWKIHIFHPAEGFSATISLGTLTSRIRVNPGIFTPEGLKHDYAQDKIESIRYLLLLFAEIVFIGIELF